MNSWLGLVFAVSTDTDEDRRLNRIVVCVLLGMALAFCVGVGYSLYGGQ